MYYDYDRLLECLQVRYTDALARVMMMMCPKGKQSSMPPSQDLAHTMIGDFTESTMSDSDNDLHLVRVTSARLDGRMMDIPEVEIWRTVSPWIFLLSVLLTSLLLWISAQYKWSRHRLLPPPEIGEVEVKRPCAPDPAKDCLERNNSVLELIGSFLCVR